MPPRRSRVEHGLKQVAMMSIRRKKSHSALPAVAASMQEPRQSFTSPLNVKSNRPIKKFSFFAEVADKENEENDLLSDMKSHEVTGDENETCEKVKDSLDKALNEGEEFDNTKSVSITSSHRVEEEKK